MISSKPLNDLKIFKEAYNEIKSKKEQLDDLLGLQLAALRNVMTEKASILKIPPVTLSSSREETEAARIIPVPAEKARMMNYQGYNAYITALPKEFRDSHPFYAIVNINEAAGLADGKRDLLQIKKMVDAQFERESPLKDLTNFFDVLKEAGLMKF